MRVLILEADHALGLFLKNGLKLNDHTVVLVGDGQAALDEAGLYRPDLMLLDIDLPGHNGYQVLEAILQQHNATSLLVLSGRYQVQERIRCFELGADAFLMKPFSFSELTALCNSLLRRHERFTDATLRFAGVELDRMERTVHYAGQAVDLTATEFKLLEILMKHKGTCASRDELLRTVWKSSPDMDKNIVDVYINYLRKKFAAVQPELELNSSPIETVRGKGYRVRDKRQIPRLEAPTPLTNLLQPESRVA